MRYRVELSARAEADLKEAYAYIRQHGPANPEAWKAGLDEKLTSLEAMPERCGVAPESRFARVEVRQTFYANFRILFTIRDQGVFVVTIRHGARRFLGRTEIDDLTEV
jgi:plasmid stabilization system protein ParE